MTRRSICCRLGWELGAALRTWREWFPEARLVGLDPRRIILDPAIAHCTIVQGNQTDLAALQPLLREYRFRLIIDDGSHHPDDQVQTFQLLFPWLEADSIYICAGFSESESTVSSLDKPEQPVEPSTELRKIPEQSAEQLEQPEDLATRPVGRADQRAGPAWFAELGGALAAGERGDGRTLEPLIWEFILGKATGVFLLRGSVVVTS